MATRSKPQTRYYLNYGAVTPINGADNLTPVFIGPRYIVHNDKAGNNIVSSGAVVYSGAALSVEYPQRSIVDGGYVSGATLVSSSVKVYAVNPIVQFDGDSATTTLPGEYLISGGVTVATDSVTIASGATCVYSSGGSAYTPVVSGAAVVVNYNELRTDDVNHLYAASAASSWVGEMTKDNPLGMAYKAGIQTGFDNFYLIATESEATSDFKAALGVAGKYEAAYALVPLIQNSDILADALTIVAKYSKPEIAQMKRLWVFSQLQQGAGESASEFAQRIAAEATSYSNHRVNYVYAEAGNTVAGEEFQDAQYIVPVLAAMRGAMAPHAPLTDVVIPGVSIGDSIGFTEEDYDVMNNGGVWVCYKNSEGETVSRHAITTGGVGTIAEEDSAVSNGDNILRFVRNQISFLKGNCNVTAALIDKIYTNVMHALDAILRRTYDPLIGPQIISIESVNIEQDPNNTAGVIGEINLDLPDVYLDGKFTFNLF